MRTRCGLTLSMSRPRWFHHTLRSRVPGGHSLTRPRCLFAVINTKLPSRVIRSRSPGETATLPTCICRTRCICVCRPRSWGACEPWRGSVIGSPAPHRVGAASTAMTRNRMGSIWCVRYHLALRTTGRGNAMMRLAERPCVKSRRQLLVARVCAICLD
jgi:hypothetical protein